MRVTLPANYNKEATTRVAIKVLHVSKVWKEHKLNSALGATGGFQIACSDPTIPLGWYSSDAQDTRNASVDAMIAYFHS